MLIFLVPDFALDMCVGSRYKVPFKYTMAIFSGCGATVKDLILIYRHHSSNVVVPQPMVI